MKNLKPQLVLSLREYSKEKLVKDLVAGVIVAIIALPLSIALALASGVSPEQGLYTAIVAGFLISALGGSTVQIAGPTAAFATIVAGIVAKSGMEGLAAATVLALAAGLLGGGRQCQAEGQDQQHHPEGDGVGAEPPCQHQGRHAGLDDEGEAEQQ